MNTGRMHDWWRQWECVAPWGLMKPLIPEGRPVECLIVNNLAY